MILAVYSREYLTSLLPGFFGRPSICKDGPSRFLIGVPLASHAAEGSYFIVRIGHRESRNVARRQAMKYGRSFLYPRKEFAITHYTYALYIIDWNTGRIQMLSEYATRKAALAAQREVSREASQKNILETPLDNAT
jgi:hypothetical protein